ncbi:uncharacterized protein LOC121257873 isoform X1 [Juglans microcarpa x Juglans regia]|uniref:uncharacterized protein LOC121257873 isoform X1 n=1 Tax=Juglans microcarpa x Juglans regia TaxID=2249226 RepID=UPI001B7DD475|nr:uncharacterized protein LOC121257873 isoform X1 [Juglans microcarpa x Juglans regia]XP_041015060.1 uncharacterized protein LOC121257873 isoform X1 [Juglans microcarpa x Juglans regia]
MKGSEMENTHMMLEQKLLEDNLAMPNQKLEVLDILKAAPTIFFKNFSFIIFLLFISLPLFFFMVYYEIFLQRTLTNILEQSHSHDLEYHRWSVVTSEVTTELRTTFSHQLVQLGFLYLVPFHLLELCTVIVTVDLASKIYAEDRPILTLKEMLYKPIYGARIRGTFITSFYVILLSTCNLLGLVWLATSYHVFWRTSDLQVPFLLFYGPVFIALLLKYLEWSAVWNVSIVISVLEGTFGVRAMALSARFNRGNERRGLLLMAVFFVWGLDLRLPCLYFRCYEGEIMGIVAQVGLFCLGNVLKWVACMLYFYDCKKQTLEKKVDVEAGREIKVVDA